MKNALFFTLLLISTLGHGQLSNLHLKNVVVVGQLDRAEDRYTIEVNVTEQFADAGIKAIPSLNLLKQGSDDVLLAGDSLKAIVTGKGYDTYVLVSIRGYDRKFKATERNDDFATALGVGNLFPIYRDEVASVSFEFLFYRNGQMVGSDILKCGNVSDKDSVIKKFRKVLAKRIQQKWL